MNTVRPRQGIQRIRPHMLSDAADGLPPVAVALDANDSAFGPSPRAEEAARAAVSRIGHYLEAPDRLLAPAIARRFGLDPAGITVGQGSDDLLARLARAFLGPGTELIRSANGYLKVPNYAYANDAGVASVPDDDLTPSVDAMLAAVGPRTRIVYLANPENPAGTMLPGAEIRRLHAVLPGNVLLVIDSAYREYVGGEDADAGHRLVEEAGNVVVCRTFSKIFGLAGARIGWMHGPPTIVDIIRRIGLTFPVSTPSVAAALAALEDRAHTERVFRENLRLRRWTERTLAGFGLDVTPGHGNFLLAAFPDPEHPAARAAAALRLKGVAVRRFASPAFENHIRMTIGLEWQLRAALNELADHLGRPRP